MSGSDFSVPDENQRAVLYDIGTDRVISAQLLAPELLGDLAHALSAALPDSRMVRTGACRSC